jgi:hypothetical protein
MPYPALRFFSRGSPEISLYLSISSAENNKSPAAGGEQRGAFGLNLLYRKPWQKSFAVAARPEIFYPAMPKVATLRWKSTSATG